MTHIWKVGDKAECVVADPCPVFPTSSHRVLGAIYTVQNVVEMDDVYGRPQIALKMDRDNPIHPETGVEGYSNACCFQPVAKAIS